eukprot:COSAG05_NODE_18639_length_305_cov_0.752427_1_plen_87_part_10
MHAIVFVLVYYGVVMTVCVARYRPQAGNAILFYSQTADGELDPLSLHGGCPVLDDAHVKWGSNIWVRSLANRTHTHTHTHTHTLREK